MVKFHEDGQGYFDFDSIDFSLVLIELERELNEVMEELVNLKKESYGGLGLSVLQGIWNKEDELMSRHRMLTDIWGHVFHLSRGLSFLGGAC